MHIFNKREVYIHPYYSTWHGGADLSGLPETLRFRQNCQVCDVPPPQVEESKSIIQGHYLWGGPLKIHFGHIMVDTLPRLWPWNPKRYDGVIFSALAHDRPLKNWVIPMFQKLGIDEQYITILKEPALYESVDFAFPGSALGEGPTGWYLAHLNKRNHFPKLQPGRSAGKKVYLGRCHMRNKGGLMGESWFENQFRHNGFSVLQPENLSIEDQVQTLQDAEVVVFAEGSSIYSLELISRTDAKVFMIPRRGVKANRLFEPHIYPRCKEFVRFNFDPVRRMPNAFGREGPSSPSFLLDPAKAWNSILATGILSGDFSLDDYLSHQAQDTIAYYEEHGEVAAEVLAAIPRDSQY